MEYMLEEDLVGKSNSYFNRGFRRNRILWRHVVKVSIEGGNINEY